MLVFLKLWLIASLIFTLSDAVKDLGRFRVLGGYRPKKHTLAKHVVSLRLRNQENVLFGSGHFCGGTIIAPDTILTAAHCLTNPNNTNTKEATQIVVVAGSPMRLVKEEKSQIIDVASIRIHKGFSSNFVFQRNDIAVLKLATKIVEDELTAQSIPLATEKTEIGTTCTGVGWGYILNNGPMPDEVTYVDLQIISRKKCQLMFNSKWHKFLHLVNLDPTRLRRTQLCVTDFNDIVFEGLCKGDSGGPLICNDAVVGVDSFVVNICGDGASVLTSVYHFRDWIQNRAFCLRVDEKLLFVTVVFVMHYW